MADLFQDLDETSKAFGGFVQPDPSTDYRLRQAQLDRRRKLADQLVQSAFNEPAGQMVGRVYAVNNPWGAFAKSFAGSAMNAYNDKQETELALQQRMAQSDWERARPDGSDVEASRRWLQQGQTQGLRTALQQSFMEQDAKAIEAGEQKAADRVAKAEEGAANRQARADDREDQRKWQEEQNKLYRRTADQIGARQGGANADLDRQIKEMRLEQMRNPPPSAATVKANAAAEQQRKDDADALTYIAEAKRLLPKATASGAGSLRDTIASQFGVSTEGAQAGAQLKVLAGYLTSKVPKMSGPQSDKDVAMYKEMAGNLGNEKLPMQTRMAAAVGMEKLHKKYAGQQSSDNLTPDEQAELDALRAKHGRK